ncbi:acyl-CoA carboxylase subunit epsilon [Nocardioides sp. MAHUQ-72]|uniref:acyl-CoA carboxylase subunit epsilon n=1 Tax=unclassified Nocardioides TaxID=2615069 RepID=UPI003614BFC6
MATASAGNTHAPAEAVESPEIEPLLKVVSPNATPEEIAALVTVLSSLGGGEAPTPRRKPEWQSHHRKLRASLPHGPGGWRASGLPR